MNNQISRAQPQRYAVTLDHSRNTAIALLASGQFTPAIDYMRQSLHVRIERAANIQILFRYHLNRLLDHPPATVADDAVRTRVWRNMVIHTNNIECSAATARVMKGQA